MHFLVPQPSILDLLMFVRSLGETRIARPITKLLSMPGYCALLSAIDAPPPNLALLARIEAPTEHRDNSAPRIRSCFDGSFTIMMTGNPTYDGRSCPLARRGVDGAGCNAVSVRSVWKHIMFDCSGCYATARALPNEELELLRHQHVDLP